MNVDISYVFMTTVIIQMCFNLTLIYFEGHVTDVYKYLIVSDIIYNVIFLK